LEFSGESGGQWLHPEKFQLLEDYLVFTGAYLKKFNIDANYWGVKVDPKILQKLLNLLPNLQDLELNYAEIEDSEEVIKWELKSSKIERVTINHCSTGILRLLESLGRCAIKVGVEKNWIFFYWT
jgi:heterodisulfide reductase subunit A-like polyferredoxin